MSSSSLIPSYATSFSDALPILFLEARVHGNTHQLVTQMGVSIDADQCSVGMLTRTSGVLLIAGFGSYCAYRICNRYLGKGFVWTLFDAAHCDLLARADTRLLNPDPCCSKESERRSAIVSIDEFDDDEEEDGAKTPTSSIKGLTISRRSKNGSFINLPNNSRIRRALAASPSLKEGLAGISSVALEKGGRSRRDSEASSIAGSSFSEASRIRRGERRIPRLIANADGEYDDDEDLDDSASLAPTEASEIRLLWDGDACWDDEFAAGPSTADDDKGIHSPTPSDISELSAFKTLKTMFESVEAGPSNIPEEDAIGDAADLAQLIHAKCMRSTNYMYHSVIVAGSDGGGSDIVSICSGRSTRSNLSALREKYAKRSHGLWELANSRNKHDEKILLLEPSTSKSPNPMTDSGISKMSSSSSILQLTAQQPPQQQQQMIDSAIDTGFISSDDEGGGGSGQATSSKHGLTKPSNPSTSTSSTTKAGIIRRTQLLDGIKEQQQDSSSSPSHNRLTVSSRASERSLEWFDDPL